MTRTNSHTERDATRFVLDLCEARDDKDEVARLIDERLATMSAAAQAAHLRAALRVVVARVLWTIAYNLDLKADADLTEIILHHEWLQNEGLAGDNTGDLRGPPKAPHLRVVREDDLAEPDLAVPF